MFSKTEKSDLTVLQKENKSLRNQLKDLGNKLNDLISIQETQKSKKRPLSSNPEDELKEALKLIDILEKEKAFLAKRLKKASDTDYFNKLSLKVENDTKLFNSTKASQKLVELSEKKENSYKQTIIKPSEKSEFDLLNIQRHTLIVNTSKLEETIEKNSELAEENEKKIKQLEEEHKKLLQVLGEPYLREKSMKQMMDVINKKKRIEKLMQKETSSKVNVMANKIKALQTELRGLKDSEDLMSSRILNASMQVQEYKEKFRFSPLRNYYINGVENRSYSVKPHAKKTFLSNYS